MDPAPSIVKRVLSALEPPDGRPKFRELGLRAIGGLRPPQSGEICIVVNGESRSKLLEEPESGNPADRVGHPAPWGEYWN